MRFPARTRDRIIDGSAVSLSAICVIHCLALPLLAVSMPWVAALAETEWLHQLFVLMAVPLSGALVWREVRSGKPTSFAPLVLAGLTLLALGAFAEPLHDYETHLTVIGALLISTAHARRWWRERSSSSHSKDLHE